MRTIALTIVWYLASANSFAISPRENFNIHQFEAIKKTMVESEATLKATFLGKKLFITTPMHCTVTPLNEINQKFELFEQEGKSSQLSSEEKDKIAESLRKFRRAQLERKLKTNGGNSDFVALTQVQVEDIKVLIPTRAMVDKNYSGNILKEGETANLEWNGEAELYFILAQGEIKFGIENYAYGLNKSLVTKGENLLFDTYVGEGHRLDCLSKADLSSKYKLTSKDKEAIKKQTYFIGMSDNALVLSFGRPSKVNRTVNSQGASEQWVYGMNKYFYFKGGKLKSWQD